MNAPAVVIEALSWLRTPWRHNMSIRGVGIDCGQLLRVSFVGAGAVPPFDTGDYPADWMMNRSAERFLEFVERFMVRTYAVAPAPADVVVWRIGRCFAHGAIVADWPMVVHASRRDRIVLREDATRCYLAGRPMRCYRLREFAS